jgi:hypothetical protein
MTFNQSTDRLRFVDPEREGLLTESHLCLVRAEVREKSSYSSSSALVQMNEAFDTVLKVRLSPNKPGETGTV